MCVTSWVVHVHEEHVFISIQNGIELEGIDEDVRKRLAEHGPTLLQQKMVLRKAAAVADAS